MADNKKKRPGRAERAAPGASRKLDGMTEVEFWSREPAVAALLMC
jgi:hypothetical protein